jgi:hypothetical protein
LLAITLDEEADANLEKLCEINVDASFGCWVSSLVVLRPSYSARCISVYLLLFNRIFDARPIRFVYLLENLQTNLHLGTAL